jgi:TPR repeat protein
MYSEGRGVPQDDAEAARWCRKAADQGQVGTQTLLGAMYAEGKGVDQDYAEAIRWYRQAANQEDATAQSLLGAMYIFGTGVPKDYVEAHMWLGLAASRARGDDQKKFADARESLARLMTAAQIAEAQRLARDWKPPVK